jgi:hypothetical protein
MFHYPVTAKDTVMPKIPAFEREGLRETENFGRDIFPFLIVLKQDLAIYRVKSAY